MFIVQFLHTISKFFKYFCFQTKNNKGIKDSLQLHCLVMGQTTFHQTLNKLQHHFLKFKWTRTPYFWLWTIEHRTSNVVQPITIRYFHSSFLVDATDNHNAVVMNLLCLCYFWFENWNTRKTWKLFIEIVQWILT